MLSDIRTDFQQLDSPRPSSTTSTPSVMSGGSDCVEASETPDAVAAAVASAASAASDKLNRETQGLTLQLNSLTLQGAQAPTSSPRHSMACHAGSPPYTSRCFECLPANTADEVQLMADQVLQRKQTPAGEVQPALTDEKIFNPDPLKLLKSPERNLRARKERLMAQATSSGDASARVAAVKEELAGVQARLRDALGLQPSSTDESPTDFLKPPLRKRVSYEVASCSSQDGTAERLSGCGSSRGSSNKPTRSFPGHSTTPAAPRPAAAPAYAHKKASTQVAGMSTAAGTAAMKAKAVAVGVAGVAELPCGRIYFDSASEVAEMAARVLKKHSSSSQQEY